jgi:hypothetical protein
MLAVRQAAVADGSVKLLKMQASRAQMRSPRYFVVWRWAVSRTSSSYARSFPRDATGCPLGASRPPTPVQANAVDLTLSVSGTVNARQGWAACSLGDLDSDSAVETCSGW